jgi:CTP:molybdopterin cytidylyltransferase MocA
MKIGLVILAAGYSERMGVFKPLLPVGGESALLRAVGIGKSEKVHVISVVTGYRCEDVEAELGLCRAKNIRHIHNKHFDEGMFTSVQAGVHSLPSDLDGFLLLPVDICAVRPETLEKVIAAFVLDNGESVVYPTYNGRRGHPSLIPYAFVPGLKVYDGENGMRGYLSRFPSVDVEAGDEGVLLDMDTPADYAALLKFLGLPTYPDEKSCRDLMVKYQTPEPVAAHCRQVRALALRMSGLLRKKGVAIDEGLLSSACLLHDIVRETPQHARAGAEILLREGYPETAMLVASHMELPEGYVPKPDAPALLYLADKLSRGGRIVPPDVTREERRVRYAADPEALARADRKMAHAEAILQLLGARFGITYGDIADIPAE